MLVNINDNSEIPVVDPMPEMIRVWEAYALWTHHMKHRNMSFGDVDKLGDEGKNVQRLIQEVFPDKHGPRGKLGGGWQLSKFHDMQHLPRSLRLYGELEVRFFQILPGY